MLVIGFRRVDVWPAATSAGHAGLGPEGPGRVPRWRVRRRQGRLALAREKEVGARDEMVAVCPQTRLTLNQQEQSDFVFRPEFS